MSKSRYREMRDAAIEAAREIGWAHVGDDINHKHPRAVFERNGVRRFVILSFSPSDARAVKNKRSQTKKMLRGATNGNDDLDPR